MPEEPPSGLTPILAVSDAHAAIAFYALAFGATELARIPRLTRNVSST